MCCGRWPTGAAASEGLVLRQGLTLLAFPDRPARDGWLIGNSGTACGECFVLASLTAAREFKKAAVVADHLGGSRLTFRLDENGVLHSEQPVDVVQRARLYRLLGPEQGGWRLTHNAVRRASAGGMKQATFKHWLAELLGAPVPPLLASHFEAWWGKEQPVELGEAVLLHVADPGAIPGPGDQPAAASVPERQSPVPAGCRCGQKHEKSFSACSTSWDSR